MGSGGPNKITFLRSRPEPQQSHTRHSRVEIQMNNFELFPQQELGAARLPAALHQLSYLAVTKPVSGLTSTGPYRSCAALLDILFGLIQFGLVSLSLVWLVLV